MQPHNVYTPEKLGNRFKDFSLLVIYLAENNFLGSLRTSQKHQLLKSATSVGANYEEAQGAESKADFIHKLQTALKESRESVYWLALAERSSPGVAVVEKAAQEAAEIRSILTRAVVTAKTRPTYRGNNLESHMFLQ